MAKDYLKNMKTLLRQALHAQGEKQKARMRGDKKSMEAAQKAYAGAAGQFKTTKNKLRGK